MGKGILIMLADIYNDILEKKNLRENLIALKEELKNPVSLSSFRYMLAGNYDALAELLKDEDPKNRKNAALIMGELRISECVKLLWEAYKSETQMFVKASYIKAMAKLNYSAIKEELIAERDRLGNSHFEEAELKHVKEILGAINKLNIIDNSRHTFIGWNNELEAVLTTNACALDMLCEEVTARGMHVAKRLKSGVALLDARLEALKDVRIYNELLISLSSFEAVEGTAINLASYVARGKLCGLLGELHRGGTVFRYRVDVRGEKDKDKKADFVKRFSSELDRLMTGMLVNNSSDYEIEIRLVKNKDGKYMPLLKLLTYNDKRFLYRKNVLPVSIHPVNAAISVALAGKYLKEDARVLDPMCGVGTMLIERARFNNVQTLYGVDKFGKAVEAARSNTKESGDIVNYINRDYFDFTHEHLFDEIITNLPGVSQKYSREDIRGLYRNFFDKSKNILNPGSVMVVVSDDKGLIQSCTDSNDSFDIVEEFLLSSKDERYVFVIRLKK